MPLPRFALALALAAAAPVAAKVDPNSAAAGWYGVYEYSESIPRLSGVTAGIDYRVSLSDEGCRIDAQGLQTDTHIRCSARMAGKSLQIGFVSYADGSMQNQYGVARYKRGEPLLRLTRTPQGLVTHWQGYTMSDAQRRSGKFFRKRLS